VLDLAVDGTISLRSGAVDTFEERAKELEILQALNIFLSRCLPAEGENPMVRRNQLPEWRQNNLSRSPHPYTADAVPNPEKLDEKSQVWRAAEEGEVSNQGVLQTSVPAGPSSASRPKLAPFVRHTAVDVTDASYRWGLDGAIRL